MAKKKEIITLDMPEVKSATITIEGTTDLCLNKMSYGGKMSLPQFKSGKTKFQKNKWGDIITALHWKERIDEEKIYKDADEEMMNELLQTNIPCISGFGLKKSFIATISRNNVSGTGTSFSETVMLLDDLIPVEFTTHYVREIIASPKKGSPVVSNVNMFSGWKATFNINYTETAYDFNSILSIINLAGFGGGVGSGRTSGYGRFKIASVTS